MILYRLLTLANVVLDVINHFSFGKHAVVGKAVLVKYKKFPDISLTIEDLARK
jgi:hypothetical protein